VSVQVPPEIGGLSGAALCIDTENTFRTAQIVQMSRHLSLTLRRRLRTLFTLRPYWHNLRSPYRTTSLMRASTMIVGSTFSNAPKLDKLHSCMSPQKEIEGFQRFNPVAN